MSGSLPITVQWYKDESEIQPDDKYKITFFENIAGLEILNLVSKDSGSFTCIAKNEAGSTQCSGTLCVKGWNTVSCRIPPITRLSACSIFHSLVIIFFSTEPPCVLEKPESMNVLPGSKVHFGVLVSGTPPLTIKWFKNRKEILSSGDCYVVTDNMSSSLELFFVKTSDSGDYVCEIHNDVGSTSCQATLFVKGHQSFGKLPEVCLHPSVLSSHLL